MSEPDPRASGPDAVHPQPPAEPDAAHDGASVVASVAASADAPEEWPPAVTVPPAPLRPRISGTQLSIIVVALMAGAALFLSGYSLGRQVETTPGTPGGERAAFVPFWDAYRAVTEQYAGGSVDRKVVIEGAIRGMIDALGDPFSSYLSSEDYKKTLQSIAGQFEGIGAEISGRKADGSGAGCTPLGPDCQMVVVKPIDGAPADKAGVKAGDVITEIDHVSVNGLELNDAVAKVRGAKGTAVVLTIVRKVDGPITVSIVRDVIATKEVISRSLAGGQVGYIHVTGFSDNAANDFTHVLADDIKAGQRKIIVDLRGNPGGYLTTAVEVASQFIPDGVVLRERSGDGKEQVYNAQPGGLATKIHLVVLIDKGSASASEIVAGAIQDRERGLIVGATSYGKGSVQNWHELQGDNGAVRVTIASWYTPNGRSIHEAGIEPNVPVAMTDEDRTQKRDPQLDEAIRQIAGGG